MGGNIKQTQNQTDRQTATEGQPDGRKDTQAQTYSCTHKKLQGCVLQTVQPPDTNIMLSLSRVAESELRNKHPQSDSVHTSAGQRHRGPVWHGLNRGPTLAGGFWHCRMENCWLRTGGPNAFVAPAGRRKRVPQSLYPPLPTWEDCHLTGRSVPGIRSDSRTASYDGSRLRPGTLFGGLPGRGFCGKGFGLVG